MDTNAVSISSLKPEISLHFYIRLAYQFAKSFKILAV